MRLNWRLRLGGKLLLSKLPVGYGGWRRLALFRHGAMDEPEYALRVFRRHFDRYVATGGRREDFTILELGPGDSVNTALIAHAHGARECFLVDAVRAAQTDVAMYRRLGDYLRRNGYTVEPSEATSLTGLLRECNAHYLTAGLASLRELPDASADFIFSQAVLEHVRRGEFDAHLAEFHRILRPEGMMSHRVDLKDHLGGGLNNLRFSSNPWESSLFAEAGFYTNRLRASEILSSMRRTGFSCEVIHEDRWICSPLDRKYLAPEFQHLVDEDMLISGLDVVCHRRQLD